MGVIYQGILGAISGKVGPVVGGSWKGISYLRGYQHQVAQPNTAVQVAQRNRMRVMVATAQAFLTTVIKPLNDRFAVHMSGFNLFISRNIGFVNGLGIVTYPSLIFSQGSLTGVDTLGLTGSNGNPSVPVTWIDNTGTGSALATDEIYIAIINADTPSFGSSGGLATRTAATVVVTMNVAPTTADTLHCYAAFRSANGFNVSNSSYAFDIV